MNTDRLAKYSKVLATATLGLVALMLLSNIAYWLFPDVMSLYGPGFNLTALTETLDANIHQMPWPPLTGPTPPPRPPKCPPAHGAAVHAHDRL